jgi:hypothetical protein
MVTTRRKSGTVSKAAASKILEEDEVGYDMSSDQESGDYSDDDDDFNGMCWPPMHQNLVLTKIVP